jgi:hypothetical protein
MPESSVWMLVPHENAEQNLKPCVCLCDCRFNRAFGLRVTELTGDTAYSGSLRDVANSDIILTTPVGMAPSDVLVDQKGVAQARSHSSGLCVMCEQEKFDSLTKTWREHLFLMGQVGLLLIDEVRLFRVPGRQSKYRSHVLLVMN